MPTEVVNSSPSWSCTLTLRVMPDMSSGQVGDGVYHCHQFPPIYRVKSFRHIDANHVDGALVLPGIRLKPTIGSGYISCAPPTAEPALSGTHKLLKVRLQSK